MATVEEIYRKLRSGTASEFTAVSPTETELEAGVERIRARLSSSIVSRSTNVAMHSRPARILSPYIWVPAIAALLIMGLIFWPKKEIQQIAALPAGSTFNHESVHIRVLKEAIFEPIISAGKLSIELKKGILAVRRNNAATALDIKTPEGRLTAQGTIFIVEYDAATSVQLLEGKLRWQNGATERIIDLKNFRLGRDLRAEAVLVPTEFQPIPQKKNMTQSSLLGFKPGACVTYYRNNEKRRGKIYAHDQAGYIIHGASGPEPGHFRDSDFFSRGCDE